VKRLALVLLASALLQSALASVPDAMGDVSLFGEWTRRLTSEGLLRSYWPAPAAEDASGIDYPPVFPYMLWTLGRVVAVAAPDVLADDWALAFGIRLLLVSFNLATGTLLWAAFRGRAGAGGSLPAASLYLFNPVVLFDTAYWGQADGVCAFFLVVGVVTWERGRLGLAWAALATACLVKPLAWPLVPLFAFLTARRDGGVRLMASLAMAVATAAVWLAPFLAVGRLAAILRALVLQVDAMPFLSVNAHNAWWILGRGLPWTRADAPFLGALSGTTVGFLAFGAFYAVLLAWAASPRHERVLAWASASVALGFFVLSTRMHENHGFAWLPLALLAVGSDRRWRGLLVLASLSLTANMLLHDPLLCHVARPAALGPRVLLPQQVGVDASGYPGLLGEQVRGEASLGWAGLTLLNSQLNVLLLAAWLWRLRGGDRAFLGGGSRRLGLIAAFLVATGVPFVARLAGAPRLGDQAERDLDRGVGAEAEHEQHQYDGDGPAGPPEAGDALEQRADADGHRHHHVVVVLEQEVEEQVHARDDREDREPQHYETTLARLGPAQAGEAGEGRQGYE
jgi:hypothetical protein